MITHAASISSILAIFVALSSSVHADPQIKGDRIQAAASQGRDSWRSTRNTLKSLVANKPLRAKIGATSQVLVLGERSGSFIQPTLAYQKSLQFGLSEFTGYINVKVKWKEQLVLGSKGLSIHRLHSISRPSEQSVRSFQTNLDGQFALKPSVIKIPSGEVTYEPFTPDRLVNARPARLGWFGLGSTRLQAETWGHVTSDKIEAALQKAENE